MRLVTRCAIAALATTLAGVGGSAALAQAGSKPLSPNASIGKQSQGALAALASAPTNQETGTVSISPCRIVDTRGGGGLMSAGVARSFYAAGTVGFPAQGGKSGGCGIPASATAINVVFQSTGATGNGYVNETPYGVAFSTASLLHYAKGQTIGSGASFTLTPGTGQGFTLKTSGNKVHLLVDVVGYSLPAIHAVLAPTGGIYSGSPRVISSDNLATGSYRVLLDRNPANCTPIANINGNAYIASAYVSGGYIYANTYTVNGVATNVYWALTVDC